MSIQYVIACELTLSQYYKVRSSSLCCYVKCVIDYAESIRFLRRTGQKNRVNQSQLHSCTHTLTFYNRGKVVNLGDLSIPSTLVAGSALEVADSEKYVTQYQAQVRSMVFVHTNLFVNNSNSIYFGSIQLHGGKRGRRQRRH
jgi:hypothetical protein